MKVTNNKEELKKSVLLHLHNTCKKLRRYNLSMSEITVMLRTKDFRILSATEPVFPATNSEYLLNKKALALFEQIYSEYILYRSSGIYANGLETTEAKQINLFDATEKFENLSKICDKIEEKYGYGFIKTGIYN